MSDLVFTRNAIEVWLNDKLGEQLSETCHGCPHYRSYRDFDAGGAHAAGGMPPRVELNLECEATHFRQCRKLREPLEELLGL